MNIFKLTDVQREQVTGLLNRINGLDFSEPSNQPNQNLADRYFEATSTRFGNLDLEEAPKEINDDDEPRIISNGHIYEIYNLINNIRNRLQDILINPELKQLNYKL